LRSGKLVKLENGEQGAMILFMKNSERGAN
jgi:hypothetical protein